MHWIEHHVWCVLSAPNFKVTALKLGDSCAPKWEFSSTVCINLKSSTTAFLKGMHMWCMIHGRGESGISAVARLLQDILHITV